MTVILEEFCRLYIHEIVRLHGGPVSIVSDRDHEIYGILLEEFPKGHGDIIDDEHNISSSDIWSVGEDHIDFRGHAACMCPGSQG